MDLHHLLQQFRGRLRVLCRVKPVESGVQSILRFPEAYGSEPRTLTTIELANDPSRRNRFFFDRVFDQSSTQEMVRE